VIDIFFLVTVTDFALLQPFLVAVEIVFISCLLYLMLVLWLILFMMAPTLLYFILLLHFMKVDLGLFCLIMDLRLLLGISLLIIIKLLHTTEVVV